MTFKNKWLAAVEQKQSILCVGLDPAEHGQRKGASLPIQQNKLDWCIDFIKKVSPHAAAIKPNRNYLKDFSRADMKALNDAIHHYGMVSIDDSKLADIGDTNDAGIYHAACEGYDAVTYAPFPGNIRETQAFAAHHHMGLIVLVLMSNPEYEVIKNATIKGQKAFEYFAHEVKACGADGIVIGAPSAKNHITPQEIHRVREIIGQPLVLVPGIGAQGGDLQEILKTFGDHTIANVGRAILYADDPANEARVYHRMIENMRKAMR